MDIDTVRAFFMWATIMNAGLLALGGLFMVAASGWVYRMHSRWFPMPRETFNVVIYALFGAYKVAVVVFFLVPYIALCLLD